MGASSNDIALLVLASPTSKPTVALPGGAGPEAGETVWAAGFGVTESTDGGDVLM